MVSQLYYPDVREFSVPNFFKALLLLPLPLVYGLSPTLLKPTMSLSPPPSSRKSKLFNSPLILPFECSPLKLVLLLSLLFSSYFISQYTIHLLHTSSIPPLSD